MHTRQSTMFKPLAIFVIFLAVSSLTYGQDNGDDNDEDSTAVATLPEDDDADSGGSITDILRLPFSVVWKFLSPITNALRFITSLIFSLISRIPSPLLRMLHVTSASFREVESLSSDIFAKLESALSLPVSNGSGELSEPLSNISGQTSVGRRKRSTMDSLVGTMWMTLPFAFRLVRYVYDLIISPLSFIYNIVTWPYHFIFHGGGNDLPTETAQSASSSLTDFSSIYDLVNSFLLKLSDSSQDAIYKMLFGVWTMAKTVLLPMLDNFITMATASDYVPEDIKNWLQRLHSLYSILRMVGLL